MIYSKNISSSFYVALLDRKPATINSMLAFCFHCILVVFNCFFLGVAGLHAEEVLGSAVAHRVDMLHRDDAGGGADAGDGAPCRCLRLGFGLGQQAPHRRLLGNDTIRRLK